LGLLQESGVVPAMVQTWLIACTKSFSLSEAIVPRVAIAIEVREYAFNCVKIYAKTELALYSEKAGWADSEAKCEE
jgi:hypothetical protein